LTAEDEMSSGEKKSELTAEEEVSSEERKSEYRSLIGSIGYYAMTVHFDIRRVGTMYPSCDQPL
jgi:hypothetical protein